MRKNVKTIGTIAKFSIVDKRLFQHWDADKISDALSSPMRHITEMTLISDTPTTENMLITDVVLKVLVVLSRDDSNPFLLLSL